MRSQKGYHHKCVLMDCSRHITLYYQLCLDAPYEMKIFTFNLTSLVDDNKASFKTLQSLQPN